MFRIAIAVSQGAAMHEPVLYRGGLESSFDYAKKLGYDGVELHIRDPYEVDSQALLSRQQETGVRIAAVATGLAARVDGLSLADKDEDRRKEAVHRVKGHLQLSSLFGCPVILGSIRGNVPSPGQRKEHISRLRTSILELAKEMEDKDSYLVFEVINRYENNYFNTAWETAQFINSLPTKKVKLHLDTFHMNIEEKDPLKAISESGALLGHFHLADNTRWYPGSGTIHFPAILRQLSQSGYTGWLSMEYLPLPTEEQAAQEGLAYIRSCIKEQ